MITRRSTQLRASSAYNSSSQKPMAAASAGAAVGEDDAADARPVGGRKAHRAGFAGGVESAAAQVEGPQPAQVRWTCLTHTAY